MLSARTLRRPPLIGMGHVLPLIVVLFAATTGLGDGRDSDSSRQDSPRPQQAQPPPPPPPPRAQPTPPPTRAPAPVWRGQAPSAPHLPPASRLDDVRHVDRPQSPQPNVNQGRTPTLQRPNFPRPSPPQDFRQHEPRDYNPRQTTPPPQGRNPPPQDHRGPDGDRDWRHDPSRGGNIRPPDGRPPSSRDHRPPGDNQDWRRDPDRPGNIRPPDRQYPPTRDRRPPDANRDWRREPAHGGNIRPPDRDRRPWGNDTRDHWRDWTRFHDRDDRRFRYHPGRSTWAYWDPYGFYDPFWGGYYVWYGSYYSWYSYAYSPYPNYSDETSAPAQESYSEPEPQPPQPGAIPLYFAPNPPPLGTQLPPTLDMSAGAAPAGLAPWIDEPFYGPLATRLAAGDLPGSTLALLNTYRAAKLAALRALRQKLASVASLGPDARRRALSEFAREQSASLSELDDRSGQIRRLLVNQGDTNPWYGQRPWRLDPQTANLAPDALKRLQFQVVRAAASYGDGFPTAFRWLLRETAMDLQMSALAAPPSSAPQGEPQSRLVFFSPSTSRVILPGNLPDDLATEFAAYDSEKRAIRAELVASLTDSDALSAEGRRQADLAVVVRLTPRLIALEALADQIRDRVAATPGLFAPEHRVDIPGDLAVRLSEFLDECAQLRDRVYAEFEKLRALAAPATLRMLPPGSEPPQAALTVALTPRLGQSEERITTMRADLEAFNRVWTPRIADNEARSAQLQADIARRFTSFPGAPTGLSSGAEYRLCEDQVRDEQTWQQYAEYQTALFEPGLSPAQRRLLYDGALQKLALQLPPADTTWQQGD